MPVSAGREQTEPRSSSLDVPLGETLAFVQRLLPSAGRILEIGCGDGRLVRALATLGHQVVGVDGDAGAIAAAQRAQDQHDPRDPRRGDFDARLARFPDFDPARGEPACDLVLFTRSLHHVDDLAGAARRARELTRPGGRLAIEDWAWDELDGPTLDWIAGMLADCRARRLVPRGEWPEGGSAAERAAHWLADHRGEDLHQRAAMRAAIAEHWTIETEARVPYAYRYVARYAAAQADGVGLARAALAAERAAIDERRIVPLGWRLVARRP